MDNANISTIRYDFSMFFLMRLKLFIFKNYPLVGNQTNFNVCLMVNYLILLTQVSYDKVQFFPKHCFWSSEIISKSKSDKKDYMCNYISSYDSACKSYEKLRKTRVASSQTTAQYTDMTGICVYSRFLIRNFEYFQFKSPFCVASNEI